MRVAVFGLGYVGCVSATCLARDGHDVVGVDVAESKVQMVNKGECPIREPGMDELLSNVAAAGRLRATTDAVEAVEGADVSLVCVGTPSRENGGINRDHVFSVARQIGHALRNGGRFHVSAVRSTALPGTVECFADIIAEESSKKTGTDFGVAANPEFLREGTALADFANPPFTIIGAQDPRTLETLRALYSRVGAPVMTPPVRVAEMVKYASNAFHAVKVCFANEIGNLCKSLGVDSHDLMQIFTQDRKLNISSAYLMPGFAFGGSCLPKDLNALVTEAKTLDLQTPLLGAAVTSNELHSQLAVKRILALRKRRIAVLGMSFKPGTDDLRYSPAVTVIEALLGKGYTVGVYDPDVELDRLVGANRSYIEQEIPHLASILQHDPERLLREAEVVVVAKRMPEFRELLRKLSPEQAIVDLVRIVESPSEVAGRYDGFCW